MVKGIHIDRLFKIDVLMSEIIQATPEIEDMRILNADKELLYLANHDGLVNIKKATDEHDPGSYAIPQENHYHIFSAKKRHRDHGRPVDQMYRFMYTL